MKRYLLTVILLIVGLKYGREYILSEDFQKYGDKTKAPWTCRVNVILGNFYVTMSEYKRAMPFYQRVLTRCPSTPMAEDAMFRYANCLELTVSRQEAMELYIKFAEEYKDSPKAKLALQAAERIKFN